MFRDIFFGRSERNGEPLTRHLQHVLDMCSVALEAHAGPTECPAHHTATRLHSNAANGDLDLVLEILQTLRHRCIDLGVQVPHTNTYRG